MSFIINQRIGSRTLSGFYKKEDTEGNYSRFTSAEAGYQQVFTSAQLTAETATSKLMPLAFSYAVGSRQIQVYVRYTSNQTGYVTIPPRDALAYQSSQLTYEEVDSQTVRLHGDFANSANSFTHVMVVMPHTATPSAIREKLKINDQGDNVAIDILGDGDGILLRSPNGNKWLLRVDDGGNLITEAR